MGHDAAGLASSGSWCIWFGIWWSPGSHRHCEDLASHGNSVSIRPCLYMTCSTQVATPDPGRPTPGRLGGMSTSHSRSRKSCFQCRGCLLACAVWSVCCTSVPREPFPATVLGHNQWPLTFLGSRSMCWNESMREGPPYPLVFTESSSPTHTWCCRV